MKTTAFHTVTTLCAAAMLAGCANQPPEEIIIINREVNRNMRYVVQPFKVTPTLEKCDEEPWTRHPVSIGRTGTQQRMRVCIRNGGGEYPYVIVNFEGGYGRKITGGWGNPHTRGVGDCTTATWDKAKRLEDDNIGFEIKTCLVKGHFNAISMAHVYVVAHTPTGDWALDNRFKYPVREGELGCVR